jgi:hypothetical protein
LTAFGRSAELRKGSRRSRVMIVELRKAISSQSDPSRRGLDDAVIEGRAATVNKLDRELTLIENTLDSQKAKDKKALDKSRLEKQRKQMEREEAAKAESASARAHGDHSQKQVLLQHKEAKEQDRLLGLVEEGVDELGIKATAMRTELKEQESMIDDIDAGMDTAQAGMEGAMGQMKKLLKTNDTRMICFIFILIVVLVALVIWAFTG